MRDPNPKLIPLWAALALLMLWPLPARARAYFADKKEMVRKAYLIALVEISQLKDLEPDKSCGTKEARAIVIQLLKGPGAQKITFRIPCFFPCAIVKVKPGRHLVFLQQHKGMLQGGNWHLSYRPIAEGAVEWYAGGPGQLKKRPLVEVIAELQPLILGRAKCSPLPTGDHKWPAAGVWIKPSDINSKRKMRLTRKNAAALRCTLERNMHRATTAQKVPADLQLRVVSWRLGGLDGSGPRLGTFWVSLGDKDNELILRNTLEVGKLARHGLIARLRRTKGIWRVVSLGLWHGHRRRR